MCNLSTVRDRQLGTRGGIYSHFKCFFCPDRLYYNGAHNIACTLYLSGRYRGRREAFVQTCVQHIQRNAPAMGGAETPMLIELVEGIFDQLASAEGGAGQSAN